ncbi:MAG: hypothetical protein ACJ8AW_18400 [Rhodopila sp.]
MAHFHPPAFISVYGRGDKPVSFIATREATGRDVDAAWFHENDPVAAKPLELLHKLFVQWAASQMTRSVKS